MLYSLSLIVILTSVLTGPSPVDADINSPLPADKNSLTFSPYRRTLRQLKCAPGSNENELGKFHYCYNKTIRASDSKGCEAGSHVIHDECLIFLDQDKIGDAKGMMALCKANGDSKEDVRRMDELMNCVIATGVRLCPKFEYGREYRKWFAHITGTKNCVKKL